jgi:acyl-homoserine-lactone acylase
MTPSEITIEVADDGGEPTEVTRTLWSTHHGPIVSLEPLPWSADQAIAIRDANAEITSVLAQFFGMDVATSMDEFQEVHATEQGVPWVNTIATSADGRAWYADTSATPNLSPEALAAWEAEVAAGGLLGLAYNDFGVVMLDGSDSLFEWIDDPAAPAPGLVPFSSMPQIERSDYVFNANDSYWLSNPSEPLTGFSPLHGVADVPQPPRTRTNLMLLEGHDGTWTAADIETTLFAERSAVTELLHQPLVDACTASPSVDLNGTTLDLTTACDALASWDGTFTLDARGAVLFREWLSRFDYNELIDTGRLFADAFAEFTTDGPVAEGFLTYGNPDDPTAPAYRLGLEAWSAGEWRPFLFQADDVASASTSETTAMEITELSAPRQR